MQSEIVQPLFVKVKAGVWVNPKAVDYIKQYGVDGPFTHIVFRGGEKVVIDKATADEVVQWLVPGGKVVDHSKK